jgi:hypothetical protein
VKRPPSNLPLDPTRCRYCGKPIDVQDPVCVHLPDDGRDLLTSEEENR